MEIKIGTIAKIAGKTYQVYNIIGELVCFGRTGKDGKMLNANASNAGAYTTSQIETYVKMGAIEIG